MNPRFSQIRAQSYTKKPKLQRFRLFNCFNYCFLMIYTVFCVIFKILCFFGNFILVIKKKSLSLPKNLRDYDS